MADYGVLNTGFVVKRLNEILNSDRARAVTLFQDLVLPGDVVDTSDSSILGRLIGILSPAEADVWEAAQQVYDAFNPNSATGVALDNLVFLGGLTREEPTYSTAQAIFTGDVSTFIPANQTVRPTTSSNDFQNPISITLRPSYAVGVGVRANSVTNNTLYSLSYSSSVNTNTVSYTSDSTATAIEILNGLSSAISSSHPLLTASIVNNTLYINSTDQVTSYSWTSSASLGIVKASVISSLQALETGPINQEANTITQIQTPVLGWDSVTNPFAAAVGSYEETDSELRERFRVSKYIRASNILESLYSALISLENVREVKIYENDTDVVDASGVPAHSFMPIVLGGLDTEVASIIWQNKPMGIRSFGNTSVVIMDSQGFSHSIGIERPAPIPIYIRINLTTNSSYPQDGDSIIKSNLIQYFSENFGIGDTVVYSRLYTPINNVPGHQINSLTIGTSPNPTGTSNVSIPFNKISSLSSANILITKT